MNIEFTGLPICELCEQACYEATYQDFFADGKPIERILEIKCLYYDLCSRVVKMVREKDSPLSDQKTGS